MQPFRELQIGQPAIAHPSAQDRPIAIVDFIARIFHLVSNESLHFMRN
jgi:hypothetical protein